MIPANALHAVNFCQVNGAFPCDLSLAVLAVMR